MAGRADLSVDLRLGLLALESGLIDQEQLVSVVRAWARGIGRPLGEILVARRLVDEPTRGALEARVAQDLEHSDPGDTLKPRRLAGDRPGPPAGQELSATVAYEGRPAQEGQVAMGPGPDDGEAARRFRVLRFFARGGLGEVYVALDRELNRTVALKEMQDRFAHDPDAQTRFLNEAQVTGRLEHPGIVPVYGLGRHPDGRPYYAMRLIEGETLWNAVERFHRGQASRSGSTDRELAFRRLLRSVIDTCNAVAYAHSRGIVHRDLKPENIMLGRFGETLLVDWGLAKPVEGGELPLAPGPETANPGDPSLTQPGAVVGTPCYMSPEQASGELDRIGPASDIYSLGAILYCVLVGHSPFREGDLSSVLERVRGGIFPAPRRIRRTIDPALEAICLKAMAKSPENRHASALELAGELEAWLADVRYRGEQEQAIRQMQGSLARLCLERSRHCFEREVREEGLLWLSKALEHAPPDPPEIPRLVRTSLCGWHWGDRLLERRFAHGAGVWALAFCPEGRRLAVAADDRSARLWDAATGSALCAPLVHDGAVRAVGFRPHGSVLATAGDDGSLRQWDAVTGEPTADPIPLGSPVVSLMYSPDGSRIVTVGATQVPLLWNAETGRPLRTPRGRRERTLAVAFSPDGAVLAVADEPGRLTLLASASGEPVGAPRSVSSPISVLAFDPVGRSLLTGHLDGDANLWDLRSNEPVLTLGHQGAVCALAYRPDGRVFATAAESGTARLWSAPSGRPVGELLTHKAAIQRLAFTPDGHLIVTGSLDGTVRLWCASTGLPVGPHLWQGGAVRDLAVSPDSRRLAVGGSDGAARCWHIPVPVEGSAERISCWVRVTTNRDFDEGDAIVPLDGAAGWDLRRRLSDLGGPPLKSLHS